MRLINTQTFKLKDFSYETIPPYAILSHTWGDDSEELTLRDVENGNTSKAGIGSTKLRGCCEQAQKDGLEYAWIDTCCIDKANLVELSEAINSMYRWYNCASVCYAYLSDVPEDDSPSERGSKFRSSRWFQRGWTLQELLAPKHLRFFNTKWQFIGTKGTISNVIKDITHVPRQFLLGITGLHVASVAQRMSWAAQRETKRPEDLAYCMLGIFGIAMPMIYGEGGEQAFIRLQEQIMKSTRDDSILAWGLSDGTNDSRINDEDIKDSILRNKARSGNVLATSPKYFANSGQIVCWEQTHGQLQSLDMFGGSLRISLPLFTSTTTGETIGILSCGPASSPHQAVGLPLVRTSSVISNEYARLWERPSVLRTIIADGAPPELIYIKSDGQRDVSVETPTQYWLYEHDLFSQINLTLVEVEPPACWDKQTNLISQANSSNNSKPIFLRLRHNEAKCLDFVTMLENEQHESYTELPRDYKMCKVFACTRDESLLEITEIKSLGRMFPRLLGRVKETSARNEMLQLHIRAEPAEGGIMVITPDAVEVEADGTTRLLVDVELMLDFRQLLRDRSQIYPKSEEMKVRSKTYGERLQRAKQERIEVERQLRELEAKKRTLVEEEKDCAREMYYVGEEQAKLEERQVVLSDRLEHAYTQLEGMSVYDKNNQQLGKIILQEALECGDSEVVRSLFYKVDDMAAVNDGWIHLITASIRGDFDAVQRLLAIRGCQADGTDTLFGRTALSWASGNGHEAIVQLLLDTNKVDVNSRDHKGWTPLKWATEKKHTKTAHLLLDEGATLDGPLRVHRGVIRAMAFSHDSKLIVSGATDNTIKIWDTLTGQCQQTLQGYGERNVSLVVFSHDSRLVASVSDDYLIRVWNRATGRCHKILQGHANSITAVAFSHDSKLIASASKDKTIRIWDSETGIFQRRLHDDTGSYSLAISHNSRRLVVTGSRNGTVKIWDMTTGQCLQIFKGHESSVRSVALSHTSVQVASQDFGGTIKIWDMMTGGCLQTMESKHRMVNVVAFSPNSKLVVSASANTDSVEIWDSITGQLQRKIRGPDLTTGSIAISQDAQLVASAPVHNMEGRIKVWDKIVL
ncbi:hypothetical protein THAR02_05524 [Trichoderma harzianum]|uniref:Heterokaryon incompatibility domain-containing protein n=1 Tax=Trichoderma harzianum TaxID=5544 RepID=A0A0F9ZQ25_TRIHA|nr:hypothetical protein THAR02_05524 [Trichoderma harzianum]